MKKFVDKFHFITNETPKMSSVSQAQKACEAGGKWIQYRCLHKSDTDILEEINQIAAICDDWGTTLIVTDHIHLAGKADIQGFHIENPEADIAAIRRELGDAYTLGVSALSPDAVLKMAKAGADYIGFGPFAKTTTKPNNFPFISLETYQKTVENLNKIGLNIPIIAVGGIEVQNIQDLRNTGVYGIAASAAIINAPDFEEAYASFLP